MNKPFCVAYRETRDKIIEVLNNSGLPFDAMTAILEKLTGVTTAQAEEEYKNELTKQQDTETPTEHNEE